MEIVDQEIERVLPAFRAATHCELLSEDEVKQIILKRKKDEAKLIKRECQLADYINFLHVDNMILKLLGKVYIFIDHLVNFVSDTVIRTDPLNQG